MNGRDKYPSEAAERFQIRLPDGLRDKIKSAAAENGRSMNAEIIARLEGNGETLRDKFAAQALAGLLASQVDDAPQGRGFETIAAHYSETAYRYGDAMIAARNKIASPAGETIRSAQDEAMEASPVTAQPAVGEASPSIAERVRKLIADMIGFEIEAVTDASTWTELNCDSLDTVELVMAFEEEFDIQIPDDAAETILTVGDAIRHIEREARNG